MYDELSSLLSALVAVFFGTALLVLCGRKKKPFDKPRSHAPSTSTKSPASGVPTFNHGVCVMYEGKPDSKEHVMTISEVEPEDGKADAKVKAKKPDKMKYVNYYIKEAQADFAVKLLQHVSQKKKDASVIMSPVSVAVALATVYAGAKAETKAQLGKLIANVSAITGDPDIEIHSHFGSVVEELSAAHDQYTLEAANRVYVQKDFTVPDAFKADIKRYYLGLFQQVDFKDGAKAAQKINDFVAEKTHQKIKDVIAPNDIDEDTRLMLVNAIYFKGAWKSKFDKAKTQKKTFYISEGDETKVDMMHLTRLLIYFADDDAQVLGLPYQGDELFMFIVLPRERYGLQKFLCSLDGKKLSQYLGKTGKRVVNVQLPRFKVETSLALKETLASLGMTDAFDPKKADFRGIAKEPTFIYAVHHKAFVEVNEEGTEATAATRMSNAPTCARMSSRCDPETFTANHPFLYVIASSTADVFFVGHVSSFK